MRTLTKNQWTAVQVVALIALGIWFSHAYAASVPYSCAGCYALWPDWMCRLQGCP